MRDIREKINGKLARVYVGANKFFTKFSGGIRRGDLQKLGWFDLQQNTNIIGMYFLSIAVVGTWRARSC